MGWNVARELAQRRHFKFCGKRLYCLHSILSREREQRGGEKHAQISQLVELETYYVTSHLLLYIQRALRATVLRILICGFRILSKEFVKVTELKVMMEGGKSGDPW